MLAVRDCVSWLRHDTSADNPAAGRIDFTYGHGRSQCGRFLRQFLYDGMNLDESGRQVFDGLNPHVAGARRGEFNQRCGQPSETNPRGVRAVWSRSIGDDLLLRHARWAGCRSIFTTNTSSEYWRSDCSLIHTDLSGEHDVEPPPEERIYLIAGHQHGPGEAVLTDTTPAGARGANTFNMVDGSTDRARASGAPGRVGLRGHSAAGQRLPTPGRWHRRDARSRARTDARPSPALTLLDPDQMPTLRRRSYTGEPYPSYASAVDADGNEVAGHSPARPDRAGRQSHRLGRPPSGHRRAPASSWTCMGITLPFAATATERAERGDPRPAIAERYRDRDGLRRPGARRRAKSWPRPATSWTKTSTWWSSWPRSATTSWRQHPLGYRVSGDGSRLAG